MKGIIKAALYSLIFVITSVSMLYSQPGDPGGDPDVPISGLGWLIALAIGIGIRFIKKRKE